MGRPNLDRLLTNMRLIESIEKQEYPAVRKSLYHAWYYHKKGWVELSDESLAALDYGFQYMYAVEAANWEYQLHSCSHWRDS